ncbi:hypothetical protein STEG23_026348, partial [Scotinomys teguina]
MTYGHLSKVEQSEVYPKQVLNGYRHFVNPLMYSASVIPVAVDVGSDMSYGCELNASMTLR